MEEVVSTQWEFGGWLKALSPGAAGLVLAAILAVAALTTWWSYRHARQKLTVPKAITLGALRSLFLLAVVLCLANPTRVERTYLEGSDPGTVAVVVDHSASMQREDNRGQSRLDNAMRHWRELENAIRESGRELRFYGFSHLPQEADGIDEAAQSSVPATETHLLASLEQILNDAPQGGFERVVMITDALDTTEQAPDSAAKAAADQQTAISFLPADNRMRLQPFFYIREWTTPARVLRLTKFRTELVIEAYAEEAQKMPLRLTSGETTLEDETLSLKPGRNVLKWEAEVTANEAGTMELKLATGKPDEPVNLTARVDVVDKQDVKILYYQGALDWGFRFLANVLRRDPSFQLDSIFNLGHGRTIASVNGVQAKGEMPVSGNALRGYQLLILSNVFPDQLTEHQQMAILDYVRQGGGVLFLAPDAEAAQGFAGTMLEEILPVIFEPPTDENTEAETSLNFQSKMWALRKGANIPMEKEFAAQQAKVRKVEKLTPFRFSQDAAAAQFLQTKGESGKLHMIRPEFEDSADVRGLKPGAIALAVHPTKVNPKTGEPRVLLATQQFGRGRASVLTTDGLWRWKMNEPSASHEVDTFWTQFLLHLAKAPEKMRFNGVPPMTPTGRPLAITVEQPKAGTPPLVRIFGPGVTKAIEVSVAPVPGSPGFWSGTWTPPENGMWMLTASDGANEPIDARHILQAREEVSEPLPDRGESEPDRGLMTRLASATGGELLSPGTLPGWLETGLDGEGLPVAEKHHRLWNTGWLMALALGAYAAELLLRRTWRML